jgi:tripartite ATP-independent transporter DctM subunit
MMLDFTPILMFIVLFLMLFLGVPIAFSLSFTGIVFAFFLWGFDSTSLLASAAWGVMNNFTLIAIPLFIFMSTLLEKSNIIADLYETFYKWSGGLRGGLVIATIIVGAILGAVSGVVAAGVIGLGLIAYPLMRKYEYQDGLSLGSIMASGTLGQLIPPSLNMIVYGAITGVSVSQIFAGGLSAGIFLALLFIVYVFIRTLINKDLAPALSKENRATWGEKFASLKTVFLPMILIIIVLGSIFSGAATPTEGGAVGALGTLVLCLFTKRLSIKSFLNSLSETIKMSTMVGWILIGAACFSSVFSGIGGNRMVEEIANVAPGGKWGVLILSIIFIVFLGMFLETVALIMLAAPIISPLIASYGFDPLWWAIVFMIILQTAFLTPPFGFAIFYLKSAIPKDVPIERIYKATFPFLMLQLLAAIILIAFPSFALWLPRLLE